jgi:hypothetical protein
MIDIAIKMLSSQQPNITPSAQKSILKTDVPGKSKRKMPLNDNFKFNLKFKNKYFIIDDIIKNKVNDSKTIIEFKEHLTLDLSTQDNVHNIKQSSLLVHISSE